MQFADLKLPVTSRMQLVFLGQDYKRYPCDGQLLGFRAGESLLVYFPKRPPQVLLRVGMKLEVKVAMQSGIVSFDCFVDQLCSQPYPYLHLTYPGSVTLTPLRRVPRFAFEHALSATAYTALGVTTAHLRGRFLDISLNGARVALDKELTGVVNRIDISAPVTVAGLAQTLEFSSEVKRAFDSDGSGGEFPCQYGLSFLDMPPPQRLLLLALCHELQSGNLALGAI